VRTDIPPDSIVMGNPARVVKRMSTEGTVPPPAPTIPPPAPSEADAARKP